jgi:3-deoxy-7-phosphoheptulonate synthase
MTSITVSAIRTPAQGLPQQPRWSDQRLAIRVVEWLHRAPTIVSATDVIRLRAWLADVAAGRLQVLQAGDCAERPTDCTPEVLAAKLDQLDELAATMASRTGRGVVQVGRIAGQFAKPRSAEYEEIGTQSLPVFRGMMINHFAPWRQAREHDPLGLVHAHRWAGEGARWISERASVDGGRTWCSHEALVLDYERPQMHRGPDGQRYLTSTHWPWIGERTRDPGGPHVELLAAVANPVAVKVGPRAQVAEILELCRRLDPARSPGRLTLIARMGRAACADRLVALAAAVRDAAYPVIWMCDPMHGNTRTNAHGLKTRVIIDLMAEVEAFVATLHALGLSPGGVHLEATPFPVTECADADAEVDRITARGYHSLCDPRLNQPQAMRVCAKWADSLQAR